MLVTKKNDGNTILVEMGFEKENLSTIWLETKLDSTAYGCLISVVKELNKYISIVAHDFFATKEGAEFFYKVKELGNIYVTTIFASPILGDSAESKLEWICRILAEMDIEDVTCYKCYKTKILGDKYGKAAEYLVKENDRTLVNIAGHYGFVFEIDKCPFINVDLSMWSYVFAPTMAFIGFGWDKAFPITFVTIAETLQTVPEHTRRAMMAHHEDAITPAIKMLLNTK